jgi:hypothetical protein
LDVLKWLKSKDFIDEQPSNIFEKCKTFEVLKLDNSIDDNNEHL